MSGNRKHNLAKGYSVLSYFVSLIGGFFCGLSVCALTGAAENQGLAGGAIVLFYGLIGSALALILAFFIAYKFGKKVIVGSMVFYGLAIIATILLLGANKQKRELERINNQQDSEKVIIIPFSEENTLDT